MVSIAEGHCCRPHDGGGDDDHRKATGSNRGLRCFQTHRGRRTGRSSRPTTPATRSNDLDDRPRCRLMNRLIVDGGIEAAAAIRRIGRPSFSMAALRCSDGGIRCTLIMAILPSVVTRCPTATLRIPNSRNPWMAKIVQPSTYATGRNSRPKASASLAAVSNVRPRCRSSRYMKRSIVVDDTPAATPMA